MQVRLCFLLEWFKTHFCLIFACFLLVFFTHFCLFFFTHFCLFFHSFLLVFFTHFCLFFFTHFCLFFFKNQLQAQTRFRLVDYGYQAAFRKLIGSKLNSYGWALNPECFYLMLPNIHKGVGGLQTGKGPHLGTSVFMGVESTSPWEHWSFWRRGGTASEVEFV